MHIGNSIICPVTGIPMIAIMGAAAYYAIKNAEFKNKNIFLVTTLTAMVFALQMINFAIPMTGSSGHIIGTILLAALLGPNIAFLAMSLIIIVQAVFFADGGILALGCNIFNMAFIPCFIVYPLLFKPLQNKNKLISASLLSSVAALQLGAFCAVVEAALSGSLSGNIYNFLSLMQMIHLPIGFIEGIFTAITVILMQKENFSKISSYTFGFISIIIACFISNYASNKPDGLEWSLLNISDNLIQQTNGIIYLISETLQSKTAILLNINNVLANIAGILIISCLMILLTKISLFKTINKNE